MPLPNFFIVGAPKAGTDELYYELDQHPEIYMSPLKEPCYFSSEIRLENFEPSLRPRAELVAASLRRYLDEGAPHKRFSGIVCDPRDYARLFAAVKGEKAIGEGSVCYLWSRSAPVAIAETIPHARIIIVLMDPAERAFHQYLKSVSDGRARHSFREYLEAAKHYGPQLGACHPFLEFGNYFEQVSCYVERFPREQLHISFYEDARLDRRRWLSSLFSFLGVDGDFVPSPVEVPSKPRLRQLAGAAILRSAVPPILRKAARRLLDRGGHLPELPAEERATLVNYYRDDILRLQDLLRRDLSTWLL